jgi:hypothetical protein
MLTPPPVDAKPGSKYKPWFKLTEYEMAFLRKTMKKNAVWTPSDTMIRRYLRDNKRGPEFYEKAKAEAEANGEEFLDEDPIDPDKSVLAPGEVAPDLPSGQAQALENRGMRLNVAKKEKAQKRKEQAEREAAEAAAAAAAAAEETEYTRKPKRDRGSKKDLPTRPISRKEALQTANRELEQLGLDLKDIFNTNSTPLQESITITIPSSGKRELKSSKKRKRDSEKETTVTTAESPAPKEVTAQPGPKKLKINHLALASKQSSKQKEDLSPTQTTTVTTTTTIPLAPAGASPTRTTSKRQPTPGPASSPSDTRTAPVQPTAAQSRPRRTSGGIRATVETVEPAPAAGKEVNVNETKDHDLRPRSRGSMTGKAASAEPPSKPQRELREKRRASVVEAHPASDSATAAAVTAPRATRANRRPAPGFVTDEADGKGKVSVGKRKAAPKKGGKERKDGAQEAEDVIDPDEPRYCICGDVSWGTMVACENGEVCCPYPSVTLLNKGLATNPVVAVRKRMVSPRLCRSIRATITKTDVVLSRVSREAQGLGEWRPISRIKS